MVSIIGWRAAKQLSSPYSLSLCRGHCMYVKVMVKGNGSYSILDIAPLLVKESHCRDALVWHVLSRDFTVLPAHPRFYPRME